MNSDAKTGDIQLFESPPVDVHSRPRSTAASNIGTIVIRKLSKNRVIRLASFFVSGNLVIFCITELFDNKAMTMYEIDIEMNAIATTVSLDSTIARSRAEIMAIIIM